MCSLCHAVLLSISSCCCLCLHNCVISAEHRDSKVSSELNNTLDSIESLVTDEERGGNPFIADQAADVRE